MRNGPGGWFPFVGRSAALDALFGASHQASTQRVSLVIGPAGIGKTTLLQEFRSRALQSGLKVGWGVAGEWEGMPGLWPWFEALSELDPDQPVISPVQEVQADPPDMAEMFRRVAVWLTDRGRHNHFVLVLEDLHEADPTAVALFSYLSRRPPIPGVAIVASARPGCESLDSLRCARITVGGLSEEDIVNLGAALGHEIDHETAADFVKRTNGNPLFVRRLLEQNATDPHAPVPQDVAVLLRQQVASAPDQAKPALRALAVLGSASVDVLRHVTGGAAVTSTIAQVSGDVVSIRQGTASFCHSLLRQVVYDDLNSSDRFALHARAAQILRSEGASPKVIAHHLSRAAVNHHGREAADAACEAARIERSAGAIGEAAQHFAMAVNLIRESGDSDALAGVLIEESEALASLGRLKEAGDRLVEAAQSAATAPPERRRQLVRSYGRLRWLEEPNPSSLDAAFLTGFASRWLDAEADPQDEAVLYTALATAGEIRGGSLGDLAAADRAVSAATAADDPALLGEAHLARRRALSFHPAKFAKRRVDSEAALRFANQLEDRELRIRAQRMALTDALASSDHGRAYRLLASEPVSVAGRVQRALATATVAAIEGRYQDADVVLDDTIQELEYLNIEAPPLEFARTVYAWDRGELSVAIKKYEALLPMVADPVLRSVVALSKVMEGDEQGATKLIDEALDTLQSDQPTVLWGLSMALLSEAAAAVRHPRCGEIYEALLPLRGQCAIAMTTASGWVGAFDRYLGLLSLSLGRTEEAINHLHQSLAIHERMHARPWSARSHAALSAGYLLLGDQAKAHKHQADATRLADLVGMERSVTLIGNFEAEPSCLDAGVVDLDVARPVAVLARQGEVWRVGLGADTHLLRHSNGLAYLDRLIRQPGRDWHALDLYSVTTGSTVAADDTGPMLDEEARQSYQLRYGDLQEVLEQAKRDADLGTAETAQAEMHHLETELVAAFGLSGRPRMTGDSAEKARVNVRRAISRSIQRIADVSLVLADHLDRSVRTGRFCCYDPGPSAAITWKS